MAVRFRISGLFPSQPSPLGDFPVLPTAADVADRVVSVLVKFDQRPNNSIERTRPSRPGCNPSVMWAGSLISVVRQHRAGAFCIYPKSDQSLSRGSPSILQRPPAFCRTGDRCMDIAGPVLPNHALHPQLPLRFSRSKSCSYFKVLSALHPSRQRQWGELGRWAARRTPLVVAACRLAPGQKVCRQLGSPCTMYLHGSPQAFRSRGTVRGSHPPIVPICSLLPESCRRGRVHQACTSTPDSCRRVRAGRHRASLCFRR